MVSMRLSLPGGWYKQQRESFQKVGVIGKVPTALLPPDICCVHPDFKNRTPTFRKLFDLCNILTMKRWNGIRLDSFPESIPRWFTRVCSPEAPRHLFRGTSSPTLCSCHTGADSCWLGRVLTIFDFDLWCLGTLRFLYVWLLESWHLKFSEALEVPAVLMK